MKQEILCTVLNSESSKVSEFSSSLYPTDNIGVYFLCYVYFFLTEEWIHATWGFLEETFSALEHLLLEFTLSLHASVA